MKARSCRSCADLAGHAFVEEEGPSPQRWGLGPNYEYGWYSHGYHKVLYCVSGCIVFDTREGYIGMEPGDRLDL